MTEERELRDGRVELESSASTHAATASRRTAQPFPPPCPASASGSGWRTKARLKLIEILRASPERATPFCPWFGTCGGCAAQHMSEALYRDWKRGLVVEALGAGEDRSRSRAADRRAWRGTAAGDLPRPLSAWRARTRSASCGRARTPSCRSTPARCSRRRWRARSRRRARSPGISAGSASRSTSA